MSYIRLVRPHESPRPVGEVATPIAVGALARGGSRRSRAVAIVAALAAASFGGAWWSYTADTRALRALPDHQRLLLYQHTIDTLRTVCDPAAPRSLRGFCHEQAELVLKFGECEASPACGALARRHLARVYR